MLKVYKQLPEATIPQYATTSSACFDIHACLVSGGTLTRRGVTNVEHTLTVPHNQSVCLGPGQRLLVPTGLIFDIPPEHSIRFHPRSGLAFKSGICLTNCEGVIDEDYVAPVFVSLINSSKQSFVISHGDRICQAELVKDCRVVLEVTEVRPINKTNRSGGFGSTGV